MQSLLKNIGLVLIVASCSGLGLHVSYLYDCRIRQCRQVEQALQRLLGEIRFHQIPLEEALRETGQALGEDAFSTFLFHVADGLGRQEFTLAQIWQQELEQYLEISLLQEERDLLLPLGRQLGVLDLESQIRSLQQCLDQWHGHMNQLQQKEENYGRLCRGLGMSMGAFLAILFF